MNLECSPTFKENPNDDSFAKNEEISKREDGKTIQPYIKTESRQSEKIIREAEKQLED